ncbi:MAG: hypothetical protein QW076_05535, partial [Candidatus Anstonellales archaeon]
NGYQYCMNLVKNYSVMYPNCTSVIQNGSRYCEINCIVQCPDITIRCGNSSVECLKNAYLYEQLYPGCNYSKKCSLCTYPTQNQNLTNLSACLMVIPACGKSFSECTESARRLEQTFPGCNYTLYCSICRYNTTANCPVIYPPCWSSDNKICEIAVKEMEKKYLGCSYSYLCKFCQYYCADPYPRFGGYIESISTTTQNTYSVSSISSQQSNNSYCPDILPQVPCGNSLQECLDKASAYDSNYPSCSTKLAQRCYSCQYNKTINLTPCIVSGCDRDICSDRIYISNCLNRSWSKCYQLIKCERIPELNYSCGWRYDEKFKECYMNATGAKTLWCPEPDSIVKSYKILNCTNGYEGCYRAAYRLNQIFLGCQYERYCEICKMELYPV